jgi:hypothetical protein
MRNGEGSRTMTKKINLPCDGDGERHRPYAVA